MRILYLCHRIPYPPNKGDKIRAFHQLRTMAAWHEVDLFTLADDTSDLAHQAALAQYCRRITIARLNPALAQLQGLPFLLTRRPLTLPYFYCSELNEKIRRALVKRSYDRIFVYCSAMAQYVEWVDQIPILLDLVDVDSDKWLQYAAFSRFPFSAIYRREGRALREYERKMCGKVCCVLVTTEREAELVRQISDNARVLVVSNGVDTKYFNPPAAMRDHTRLAIVFTGDMSYFPNQDAVIYFARKVLPLIHRSVPEARFLVVGRNPGRNVRQLQRIPGVEVTGFVPDVRAYLAESSLAVAPFSIAAGIQNKILEAMAYGLPVVATSRAVQGLSPGVAELIEIGDSPEEFAAKVVRLLSDRRYARQKGMDGRRRVTVDYSWERALDRLMDLLENPLGTGISKGEAAPHDAGSGIAAGLKRR